LDYNFRVLDSTPESHEREIAAETAHHAMVAGWDKAIEIVGRKHGLKRFAMENVLNRVHKAQKGKDPAERLDELNDWETERNGKSQLIRGSNSLHKLSPGLRKYMEKKLSLNSKDG
jgi:hypothetical protein